STNLTTRVKSVCEKRLLGVVAIKKCVNCQFELQRKFGRLYHGDKNKSESDEKGLHKETQQCQEWEKVSKILNLSETKIFEKFTELESEVQACGLWTDDLDRFSNNFFAVEL
ncbi:hypothetical protein AVEN_208300-1, partial [Araneus ventricosus]